MTFERKYTEIVLVLRLAICHTVWSSISIVKAGVLFWRSNSSELFGCDHLSDIPNFEELVFSIASYVNSVPFAANVCDSFCMSNKNTYRLVILDSSSVPNFDHSVIATRQ